MKMLSNKTKENLGSAAIVLLFLGGYWGFKELKSNWIEKPRIEWNSLQQKTESVKKTNSAWMRGKANELEQKAVNYKSPVDKNSIPKAEEYTETLMQGAMQTNLHSRQVADELMQRMETYYRINAPNLSLSITEQATLDVRKMLENKQFRKELAAKFNENDVDCKAISALYLCTLSGRAGQMLHRQSRGAYEIEMVTGIFFAENNPRKDNGHQWIKADGKIQDLRVEKSNPSQYVPLVGSKIRVVYQKNPILISGPVINLSSEPEIYTLPESLLKAAPKTQKFSISN